MATRQDIFSIDGQYFDVFIPQNGIERNFAVVDTDEAGRVLTGAMERDVIGTFYNYTIKMNTNFLSFEEYDALYEIISSPDDYHMITVPYGQETLTFKAYVTQGKDVLNRMSSKGNHWKQLSVNFIAMEPERYYTGSSSPSSPAVGP